MSIRHEGCPTTETSTAKVPCVFVFVLHVLIPLFNIPKAGLAAVVDVPNVRKE